MADLLPCPFCGGKAEYENDTGSDDEGFWEWYQCERCGAKAGDIAAWNRRDVRAAARLLIAKWNADNMSGLQYGAVEFAAMCRAISGAEPDQ